MNQLLELFPGLIFFVVYFIVDIYVATAALMIAVAVQFIYFKITKRTITRMMWLILFVAFISGTLTIALQDPMFIKWKPTVVSWILSVTLIVNLFIGRKNVLQMLMGDRIQLDEKTWRHQALILGVGTFLSGSVNLIVAYTFSEPIWVTYRFASIFIWPVLFALVIAVYFYATKRSPGEPTS